MTSMRNDVKHHPKLETLAAYAAGRLDEARGVVIATHATICGVCRSHLRDFEALGGLCLESARPSPMRESALDSFWARAGGQDPHLSPPSRRAANDAGLETAIPLNAYLKVGLDGIAWRPAAPGLWQHVLEADGYRAGVLRVLKIAPGVRIPKHTHGDGELTLILRGAYEDETGEFFAGDLSDVGDDVVHAPRAIGDEPCICLIATNAPLVFKGLVGRVAQPFIGL